MYTTRRGVKEVANEGGVWGHVSPATWATSNTFTRYRITSVLQSYITRPPVLLAVTSCILCVTVECAQWGGGGGRGGGGRAGRGAAIVGKLINNLLVGYILYLYDI